MTVACMTGVFRIKADAEVRELLSRELIVTLRLAYAYGRRAPDGSQTQQIVEAGLWGPRATKLAPKLVEHALIFAVIEDPHIEVYTSASGATGQKIVGRLGRVDIIADPMMTGILRTPRRTPSSAPGPAPDGATVSGMHA